MTDNVYVKKYIHTHIYTHTAYDYRKSGRKHSQVWQLILRGNITL